MCQARPTLHISNDLWCPAVVGYYAVPAVLLFLKVVITVFVFLLGEFFLNWSGLLEERPHTFENEKGGKSFYIRLGVSLGP